MNRALLIARREYGAYARTVGFWLSLLALPFFAGIGGGMAYLVERGDPVRNVAFVEAETAERPMTPAVLDALALEQRKSIAQSIRSAAVTEAGPQEAERLRSLALQEGTEPALAEMRRVAPRAAAGFSAPDQDVRVVDAPEAITSATGEARIEAVRAALASEAEPQLDAIALLGRDAAGAPSAELWVSKASDREAEFALRDSLIEVNRRESLESAGVDPGLVSGLELFRPDLQSFSPSSASGAEVSFRDQLPGIIGLAIGFLLWSLVITGASILMNSVMEEKASKVLEVLLSSASTTEIMVGKVLGVAMLTLTVLAAYAVMGIVALTSFQPQVLADVGSVLMEGGLLIYLLIYLIGGYLLYAVIFTAIGAFCETPRDAQTLMGPIMMVLIVPLLVMQLAVRTPDAPLVKILSLVPPFTPFLMSARAPSQPPLIEHVGAIGGMALLIVLAIWLSGRAFRAGALSDVKLSWKSLGSVVRGGN